MRTRARLGMLTIGFAAVFFLSGAIPKAFSASATFNRTLTVGSYGEDVRELQKILNSDAATRIQGSGSGSPGQETAYFGFLTRDAVIRYQEKHAQQILYPNGLSAGTGVVGPATRAVLAIRREAPLPTAQVAPLPSSAPISAAPAPSLSLASASSSNPNLTNIDRFLSAVENSAAKQGIPPATIALMKAQIVKDAATTTNLREAFLKTARSQPRPGAKSDSFIGKVLAIAVEAFNRVFRPEQAYASGAVPFGGALIYPYLCTCSYTWLIFLEPLPPSFPYLLTYVPFTEAFASYNIPYTSWLLGMYEPGAGSCSFYYGYGCATIPAEGMITPFVGSSAL